jgi:hypothetical protein
MAMRRLLATFILTSIIVPVLASDSHKNFRVKAIDAVESCRGLNKALSKAKKQDDWGDLYGFSLYTMGYLTAVNRLAANTYDIAGKKNSKTLMLWLESYCAEHPGDRFDDALYQLTVELYPERTVAAPEEARVPHRD